jgi:pimeloyl-ACP methyl ester carboxylesterase
VTLNIDRGLAKTFAGHIHWRACGSGPVVMVSHINQQSSAVMVELLQALAPDFRAIAIDYPSHGHSDHIDWQPTIEDYARCVIEVMDALKIERAFAMGEAVGAATSIALGSRWPQRIDKAVLINIPYFSDADTAKNDIADIAKVRPSDDSGFPAPRSIKFLSMRRCSRRSRGWIASTPPSSRSAATDGRRWARSPSSIRWPAWRR